ncbi:uncharacterized protein EKO05_0003919 [Ascochyta rabiei]|uniref:uncharacterized protein n=1 Tax=Didymella rabiei TaxID=5454 RepID=UPI0022046843|nr:uncharacterized protein EKO05_0003919 [Ascochyta rabiei]UPX13411.1 hypothetical protein EKO05_0003919 [Ascochyta rabiei]
MKSPPLRSATKLKAKSSDISTEIAFDFTPGVPSAAIYLPHSHWLRTASLNREKPSTSLLDCLIWS